MECWRFEGFSVGIAFLPHFCALCISVMNTRNSLRVIRWEVNLHLSIRKQKTCLLLTLNIMQEGKIYRSIMAKTKKEKTFVYETTRNKIFGKYFVQLNKLLGFQSSLTTLFYQKYYLEQKSDAHLIISLCCQCQACNSRKNIYHVLFIYAGKSYCIPNISKRKALLSGRNYFH